MIPRRAARRWCWRRWCTGRIVAHLTLHTADMLTFRHARHAIVTALIAASPLSAQQAPASPWVQESVASARLNEARPVFVVTPANYHGTTERFPVLVILDANDRDQFLLAVANVGFLANRGAIPQMIIVGIPNGSDRTHDLTPVATGATAIQFPSAGGAADFTGFLVDEVMPHIRALYRTLPSTILAGHSFGGLLALDVAATRPGAFTGIVAMSPALWWNDSTSVVTYADMIAKSPAPQRLFATSGGLEPEIDRTTQRFARRLESLKSATVAFAYRNYPGDSHGLTPGPSLVDGLRFIFDPIAVTSLPVSTLGPNSDSAAVVRAVLETEQRYARGARVFGMSERLPENVLNGLGYGVLQMLKKPSLAVWVFKRNAALYPESANVFDSLGDGLLAQGDTNGARVAFRTAVDIATRTRDPVMSESRRKLELLGKSP